MQIKLRRTSLARPSNRSSAATRLIVNVLQGSDPARRNRGSPWQAKQAIPPFSRADRL
jgi:hypothetical protein